MNVFKICGKGKKYFEITEDFLLRRCEVDSDGSMNLNLHGRQLNEYIGRRIEDSDIEIIIKFLHVNPKVNSILLCYNNITSYGMNELIDFLKANNTVHYLDIMMNDIGMESIEHLADVGKKIKLTALRLNANKFGRDGGIHMANFLEVNKTIEHLDIAETDLTVTSFVHIMAILRQNETLKCLDISRILGWNYYVLDIDHVVQVLYQMLSVNRSLTELHLQKMEITDFVLEVLVGALIENKTLLLLDLACNKIGDLGAQYLSTFLKSNTPLQVIMLNHNRIRKLGAIHLAHAIAFSKVRFLDLAHNKIEEEGVINILYTVRKVDNLLVLFLFGNDVTGKALLLLELWLNSGVLKQLALDVFVYRDEFNELLTAYNSEADYYNQRYYSVIGKFTSKVKKEKPGPDKLAYKYHNIVHMWCIPDSRLLDSNIKPYGNVDTISDIFEENFVELYHHLSSSSNTNESNESINELIN